MNLSPDLRGTLEAHGHSAVHWADVDGAPDAFWLELEILATPWGPSE